MKQFQLPEPADDGLFLPNVGPWSRDKHHFLRRYLDAFTKAMRHGKGWSSLHYIDLFAGAGIERLEQDGKMFGLDWGSPLIAAQVPHPFQRMHFAELEKRRHDALVERLKRFPQPSDPQIIKADANKCVAEIVKAIPARSLSVAFLDPWGLHLHFETLRALGSIRCDLIIFFPDHTDALRNWGALYEDDKNSNLDLVLGHADWRQLKNSTPPDRWPEMLTGLYVERIRTLGYQHFDFERIARTDGRFLYRLIFCSRDKAGGRIWNNISRKKAGGQQAMDFGA